MSFKKSNNIGLPGPAGKFEVPDGFTLYKAQYNGANIPGGTMVVGSESLSGNAKIELVSVVSAGGYDAGDIKVYLKGAWGEIASHTWDSSGPDARLEIEIEANEMDNNETITKASDFTESADCQPENLELCVVNLGLSRAWSSNPAELVNPWVNYQIGVQDGPSVSTLCKRNGLAVFFVLVKSSIVKKTNEGFGWTVDELG